MMNFCECLEEKQHVKSTGKLIQLKLFLWLG